jgi:plasmid stabilization system protein ParE
MALRVKISARAASHIRRAAEWWQENRLDAPGAIGQDVGEGLALLAEHPGIGSKYLGTRVPDVRRLYLGRTGYFIYYRASSSTLDVLAFWHARRGRQPKL